MFSQDLGFDNVAVTQPNFLTDIRLPSWMQKESPPSRMHSKDGIKNPARVRLLFMARRRTA